MTVGEKPGEYVNSPDGSIFVYVPPAKVELGGSPDDPNGSQEGEDHSERPAHTVELSAFFIGKYKVSTKQFAAFVARDKHETLGDRVNALNKQKKLALPRDSSRAFWFEGPRLVSIDPVRIEANYTAEPTANWRRPFGERGREAKDDDPVLQVAWADALAYALWAGATLPSEAQWECAARWNPVTNKTTVFPWGDNPPTASQASCFAPLVDDGKLLPVNALPESASPVGAIQMCGDARECVLDNMGGPTYYRWLLENPRKDFVMECDPPNHHVVKGGAYIYIGASLAGSRRAVWVGCDNITSFRLAIPAPTGPAK
jgi:iron(II)-dependent oxidoreductase